MLLSLLLTGMGVLVFRAAQLQVFNNDFLQSQGAARYERVVNVAAHRGMIRDRNGEPLAISTPVDSVWANPQELIVARDKWPQLAHILGIDIDRLQQKLAANSQREFVYLKRRVNPELAQKVVALKLPGVSLQREYRRYYPMGEVMAHVVGFTNVDDQGQEGLELAYENWLQGVSGSNRVIKDRLGHVVETVERVSAPHPGKELVLSIDRQMQYLAYRELKAAVKLHRARSASAVILDARNGEVLAMVNQPAFNPNNRTSMRGGAYRNRAVTDVFEPGSTIKPFTIAAALESGRYHAGTPIDTAPGYIKIGSKVIRDHKDYGLIDVATVIKKSSNVGASKIALALEPEQLWQMLSSVGMGVSTGSGFPGESSGLLSDFRNWHEIENVTHSFGYGLSATVLQLAQAYTILATDGLLYPATFQRQKTPAEPRRVMQAETARQVRGMLETVTAIDGTGAAARVPGYQVAGKTGTIHKSGIGGYQEDKYVSVFAGIAPASQPRLVMVVMFNEPRGKEYYGGKVAAPVFSKVMSAALRLLDVAPDVPHMQQHKPQGEPPIHSAEVAL